MKKKKAKPKPKPKPRQWNLKGWVAVPRVDLPNLEAYDLGYAYRRFNCGFTKKDVADALREHRQVGTHAILRLDIIATER